MEAKKDGAVEEGTGQADVDVEPAVTEWTCTVCFTQHDYVARQCRVCKTKRVPATNVAAAQAASSAGEVAAKVAKLQEAIIVMTAIEAEPGIIDGLKTKIDLLKKPAAPAPVPTQAAQLLAAQQAVEAAERRTSAVTEMVQSTQLRIEQQQRDLEALGRALANAQQTQQEALAALAAVQQAVGAQAANPGPTAAPAPQEATPGSTLRARADAVFTQHLAALNTPDAEMRMQIKQQTEAYKKDPGLESDLESLVAKIVAEAVASLHVEFIEDVPATAATAPASSPVTPKVQAARPAGVSVKGGADGDARLPARESIKQAALAQPSPTQVAKEGMAKLRKDERRQQIIERRRQAEADELAALDAEDATVLSDDDSHR